LSNLYKIKQTCNCCNNKKLQNIYKISSISLKSSNIKKNHVIKNNIPLTLLFCNKCKNNQLREIVDPKYLYSQFIYRTNSTLRLNKHFEDLSERLIKELKLTSIDKIIDLGSNDGTFLVPFKKKKFNVFGVEPSKILSNYANNKNIYTFNDFFTFKLSKLIKKNHGAFKLITCFNTFANIPDLNNFLKGVKNLMNSDSILIIETQYGLNVLEKKLIDTIYHEHLNYFTIKGLKILFESHNLEIFKYKKIKNKGGSIRVYARIKRNNNYKNKKLEKEIHNENNQLSKKNILTFQKFIKQNVDQLNLMILQAQKNNIDIYGFGSSVGTSALLGLYKLNCLKAIFDDKPNTDYLIFNNKKIDIVNSNKIKKINPNSIIINFAWRYSKDILNKNKDKLLLKKIDFFNLLPKLKKIKL